MSAKPLLALAVLLLLSSGFPGGPATAVAAETPAAATAPAAAAAPSVPETPAAPAAPSATVTGTVEQATASEELQRAALARLEQAERWRELAQRIAALETELDALAAGAKASPELSAPIDLDRELRALHRGSTAALDELTDIARRLEHDSDALESESRKWQERRVFLESRRVPPAVLERAQAIETKLKGASARLREFRDSVLLALDRALALQARVNGASKLVATQQERVRAHRARMEEAPLWRLDAGPAQFQHVATELRAAWRVLREYLAADGAALGALFVAVLAGTGWLFTRRCAPDAPAVQRAYGRPVAAALLVALMLLMWLAPDPPLLFYEALLVLVPIPAAMVARRALPAPIPLTLYGLAVATMLLPLRTAISASAVGDRLLLLLQAISIGVPVAIDLGRGRLRHAFPRASPGLVRVLALLVMFASGVAVINVAFGFAGPVKTVRSGVGSVLGFGLVFGTTALALYGATLALLASPVARWLRSARGPDPVLLRSVRRILTVLAVVGVVLVALGSLGLVPAVRSNFNSLMDATLDVGTVSISARALALALAVVVATIVLTGVTGYILDREVLPRLNLRPGAGYAILTFTRWSMTIIGVALTLAALGIDMTKITLIAGALSVGIGFGLQNVVNNFASGLILIVERPVSVGDVIERGTLSGTVTRIGIRSSTVRTGQGAEVIVPNGELVSKEVVNWTRSDRRRRYDIDVGVAPGSDPEQVIRLLVESAGDVPDILTDPPPRAMFKGFGDSALNFTLLAWVPTIDVGLQAQNALRVAILRKLDAAGIAIPFPQRDVHVVSAGDAARGAGV